MNEFRMEWPPSAPPPPPPPPLPHEPKPPTGSLATGVGLAWAVMVIGEIQMVMALSFFRFPGVFWLPPLALIAWALILLIRGKTRTCAGIFLGLLSIAAVVLLLVAACFGLMHNWH